MKNLTVIPASPEWYLITPVIDGKKVVDIEATPIIGWLIEIIDGSLHGDPNANSFPITYETLPRDWALLRPDRIYVFPEDRLFDSKEEVLKRFQDEI